MYFFDTYAIIEVVKGNSNYSPYMEETIFTTINNLAEVYYYFLRETNKETADQSIAKLDISFVEITEDNAIEAASFRYKYKNKKMSFIDCIGYIVAINNNLLFLTGDDDFKDGFENVEFVK